jgi:hypothetical protein
MEKKIKSTQRQVNKPLLLDYEWQLGKKTDTTNTLESSHIH